MKLAITCTTLALAAAAASSSGANVYVMSCGLPQQDDVVIARLTGAGHTAQVGVQCDAFNGEVNLAGFDAIYLQNNYNWAQAGNLPTAGATQLINWVNGGGRLVTSEWVVYYTFPTSRFGGIASIIPAVASITYSGYPNATMTVVTPDPDINAGVPASFVCPFDTYSGTETFTTAKAGATTFYNTSNLAGSAALVGWTVGAGSVYSFLSTCGPTQIGDPTFGRLFTNVFSAANPTHCGSADFDCDGDTGTDADIESFFRCIAGNCPSPPCFSNADFNADGDTATDADIEAFFRVLAGGTC